MGYGRGGGGGWRGRGRGGGRGRGYGFRAPGRGRLGKATWGAGKEDGDGEAWNAVQTSAVKERRHEVDQSDAKGGVTALRPGDAPRLGWLYNMTSTTVMDSISGKLAQATDLFFIGGDGKDFRATIVMRPYLYLSAIGNNLLELENSMRKLFAEKLACISTVALEDLDALNHLASKERKPYLKVECWTVKELVEIRTALEPYLEKSQANSRKIGVSDAASMDLSAGMDFLEDIREHDVSPLNRLAIDMKIRAGYWYKVDPDGFSGAQTDDSSAERKVEYRSASIERVPEILERATPTVLAFDIECTKEPLKFPDADNGDRVMMISWMVDGQGYLGVSRQDVSEDIAAFTYTPKPEFPGNFEIFNEPDEKALLLRFFQEFRAAVPRVVVTYNGDNFDLPFIEKRASVCGLDMYEEIGMRMASNGSKNGDCRSRTAVHMDCLYWVNRDSYLPQGSRGLKAVTRTLLGFDPLELDPEEMGPAAKERPQLLASYSVSDAVCTYYLYMKYVHPFVFSLCNILPLNPDDVLRKGSGTLCELLLMSEAKEQGIVAPNKHQSSALKTTGDGHLLESETYIGGHVEALQSGVFRSDIPMKFKIDPDAITELEEKIDDILRFAIEVEGKLDFDSVNNYDEVKTLILDALRDLRRTPNRVERPLIYHLDVAAMYPNIILTNRLQPHAIVNNSICAACDFNGTSDCQRYMKWTWRGEHYTATRSEIEMLKRAGTGSVSEDITDPAFMKRLRDYSRKNYRRITDTRIQERVASVCQRENPFYVDTVRAFRDRRYDYKQMLKRWKRKLAEAEAASNEEESREAKGMIVIYDSLQLAHKCILNSFYGYVMRRGARWYSMEMAGVVTQTGAGIIRRARQFIERIGVPLELDTDGIWCTLPISFPENFSFSTATGKTHTISFICSVFNEEVSTNFSNDQYQELISPETHEYRISTECSIFFEVDGPYRAMILPASKEENKTIKKRYAVFGEDGSLVELKGFEMKRRGELKLVKVFQSDVFKSFLQGNNLEQCYGAVAEVANRFLDVLEQQGHMYSEEALLELLMESNNMSRSLSEYIHDGQKSAAITTAKRLAELLGEQVVRDKVNCRYIICRKPEGAQVTERAIPVQIFGTERRMRKAFLRRWTKETEDEALELTELIDWEYYAGRLVSSIQKIICIPAALQQVENPVPRLELPDWLRKRTRALRDPHKQRLLGSFMVERSAEDARKDMRKEARKMKASSGDIEDITVHIEKVQDGGRGGRIVSVGKRIGSGRQEEDLPEKKPDIKDGYVSWMQYMKKKWRRERFERKFHRTQKKRDGYESDDGEDQDGSKLPLSRRRRVEGIGGFFGGALVPQRRRASVNKSLWQVVSIAETLIPGAFKLWILPLSERFDDAVGELISVPLHVPRVFYVNSRKQRQSDSERLVNKILPRNRAKLHLYRAELPEDEFQAKSRQLQAFMRSSDVEGSYETKMPLKFDAVLKLGCICKPRMPARGGENGLTSLGLSVDDLQPLGTTKQRLYLSRKGDLHHAFLYHVTAIDGSGRALFALFFPPLKLGVIVVLAPNGSKAKIDGQRLVDDIAQKVDIARPPVFDFEVTTVKSTHEAGKAIGYGLATLREAPQYVRRTAVCVQSELSERELTRIVPNMQYMPIISLPCNTGDGRFQPVQWEIPAMRSAVGRFFDMDDQLDRKTVLARYSDIPIGNLSSRDPYIQALDVSFGRELRSKNHVLWVSEGTKPDLGGHEEDENVFGEEGGANPEHLSPGAYRSICIESELMNLAVGSVLASAQMSDLEGTELTFDLSASKGVGKIDESLAAGFPLDDLAGSAGAFKVLRELVARWEKASLSSADWDEREVSTTMLEHFYRWLRSESAYLHDHALHRFVQGIMRKIFRHLMSELKQLGTNVVYASVSKIIIATPRNSSFEGLRYAAFIENILKEKPLFRKIRFAPLLGIYDSLLFMDPSNYGGVPSPEEESVLEGRVQVSTNNSRVYGIVDVPETRMNWDIARYLPPPIDLVWTQIVETFVRRPLLDYRKQMASTEESSVTKAAGDNLNPEVRAFLKRASQELYETVHDIQTKAPTLKMPEVVGLRRPLRSPPLEFVNALMAVFGLDESVQQEVSSLRRGLLQLLNVREFSKSAQFSSPVAPFLLPDTICSYCKIVVDLDVTHVKSDAHPNYPWQCEYCDHPFDKNVIELALVREAQTTFTSYQVQDLQCSKCRLVKQDHLSEYCQCSGVLDLTISNNQLEDTFLTLWAVARHNDLKLLEHITGQVLRGQGRKLTNSH